MSSVANNLGKMQPNETPPGWRSTTLGQLGEYINGRGFKKVEWSEQGLPIVRIQNLTGTGKEQNYYDGEIDERHVVNPGDLLISWAATLGAYLWAGPRAALNQHIFKVRSFVDKKFHYYLMQHMLADLYRQTHGSGMVHITKSKFDAMPVLVPETVEHQARIVADIERQFSRLDEAVANLNRAKANLKRYTAAILKAAIEGRLVETEAEIARRESRSLEHRDQPTRPMKRKGNDIDRSSVDAPTELPEGWVRAKLQAIAALVTDGDHNPPKRVEAGIPHLTAKNVRGWRIDPTGCTFISRADATRVHKRYRPKPGDLIVTCVGTVGRTAIVPEGYEFSPDRNLAAVRPSADWVDVRYLQIVLEAPMYQNKLRGASGATAQPHLYLADLRALPIPLPPISEQVRIFGEVDRVVSLISQTETAVENQLQRSKHARETILSRAFDGL